MIFELKFMRARSLYIQAGTTTALGEKQIESLRIENKLLNDTADNSQLLKEQVCKTKKSQN